MSKLQNGNYLATITSAKGITKKTIDGRTFNLINFGIKIIVDKKSYEESGKSPIVTKTMYQGLDFVDKYFKQVGATLLDCLGKKIQVTIQEEMFTNDNGEEITFYKPKWFSFLDVDGKPIKYIK